MPRIFISYRRDDSAGYVGRLYDQIKERFGEESVFMDIDAIPPGEDFVQVIDKAVSSCHVLLAVLGKQWLTITDAHGYRRIDNPNDFVRLEIAAALRRDRVRVIPVLVRGAAMPPAGQLPPDLQALSRRNAFEVSDRNFHRDVDDLLDVLGRIKTRRLPLRRLPLRWLAALLVLIGLVLGGNLLGISLSGDESPSDRDGDVVATDTPAPESPGILPASGRWRLEPRPDADNPACGDGQVREEEQHYEFHEEGDVLVRYWVDADITDPFRRIAPNTYLLGDYDGFYIRFQVLAPNHLEGRFSYPSEEFGVPPENVDDPWCRGSVSYFFVEPFE